MPKDVNKAYPHADSVAISLPLVQFSHSIHLELMPIRRAFIYKLPSRVIVCPVSTTSSGIGTTVAPYIVLSTSMTAVELGKALDQALESSHDGIAHPATWKDLAAPRLVAAGVKSEATFQKQASLVSLVVDGKMMTITPHRNGGATGVHKGFSPIDACAVSIVLSTHEILGATALQAFECCT